MKFLGKKIQIFLIFFRCKVENDHLRYYNLSKMRILLQEQRIFSYILLDDFHIEIFRRSHFLFCLFVEKGEISPELINSIFKLIEKDSGLIRKDCLDLLLEIAKNLNFEGLNALFEKIKNFKNLEYDEILLNFLKSLCISLNLKNPQVGILFFWDLIQDESFLQGFLVSKCVKMFIELLKMDLFVSLKNNFIQLSLQNIYNGNSICQSFSILFSLIKNDDLEFPMIKIIKDYNLFPELINSFEKYYLFAIEFSKINSKQIQKIDDFVIFPLNFKKIL